MRNNLDFNVSTKLFISGFTINPNKNLSCFKDIISGLCNYYKKNHICDFDGETVHVNFLGQQIGELYVQEIMSDNESGRIGFVNLENGYFVLKIVDSVYPAEIQFDLFLNEKMTDFQIIIDHLSSPSLPFDGLGMFDYSYNISYFTKKNNIITKENKNIAPYDINEEYDFDKHQNYINNNKEYSIVLNQLKEIECYFCKSLPKYSIFYGLPRSIVFVCENHKDVGSNKELNASNEFDKDIRLLGDIFKGPEYELKIYNDNNITYGKNIKT